MHTVTKVLVVFAAVLCVLLAALTMEVGIGANLLFPIYQTHDKRFSTAFNFGDHLAIGYRHGNREFALRLQHFSNAGIKYPNPGEDFIQLRYAFHY